MHYLLVKRYYGFKMNGILGLEALLRAGAVLDLKNLTIECSAG